MKKIILKVVSKLTRNKLKTLSLAVSFMFSSLAYGIVDMENANFSRTNLDINVPNSPLNITRTYSSRSVFDGIFGYGQCSNLETTLDMSRLSQNLLQVKTCGSGLEINYALQSQKGALKTYVSTRSKSDVITYNGNTGQYQRVFKNKENQWFSSKGYLLRQMNSSGSSLSI